MRLCLDQSQNSHDRHVQKNEREVVPPRVDAPADREVVAHPRLEILDQLAPNGNHTLTPCGGVSLSGDVHRKNCKPPPSMATLSCPALTKRPPGTHPDAPLEAPRLPFADAGCAVVPVPLPPPRERGRGTCRAETPTRRTSERERSRGEETGDAAS